MNESSEFLRHEPCPHCGSSDANSLFSDGHYYCFSCETYTPAPDNGEIMSTFETQDTIFLDLEFRELKKRGLSHDTCTKWGYGVSTYRGQTVQVANYRDSQVTLKAQKARFPNNDFSVVVVEVDDQPEMVRLRLCLVPEPSALRLPPRRRRRRR